MKSILGVILARVLYASLNIYVLFFFVGACFVASGISEMLIRYDHTPSAEHLTLKLAVRDMRDGIVYIKTKKALLALLVAVLFINFFVTPFTGNFIPYFVKTDLASAPSYLFDKVLKPELWSSVFSVCFGISSLIGAAILSARRQEEKCGRKVALRILIFAGVMIALTVCYWQFVSRGVFFNGFLIAICIGALAMGILISYINIPINTSIMRIVDKDKLSKVNSITSIGSHGITPLASVLAGVILETSGSTLLLAVCSVGFTVTAVLMLISKHIKEL